MPPERRDKVLDLLEQQIAKLAGYITEQETDKVRLAARVIRLEMALLDVNLCGDLDTAQEIALNALKSEPK